MSAVRAGVWLTVLSGLTFGASGAFAKSVMGAGWSPGATVAVRLTGAAAVMVVIALIVDRRGLFDSLGQARTVLAYGTIGIALVQATFFFSVRYVPVGVSLMIQFLAPIPVMGWNWLANGRRPSTATLVGAVLALVGAALVIDVVHAGRLSVAGLAWATASMLGNAVFLVLSAHSSAILRPVVLLGTGLTAAAATVWVLAAVRLLPVAFGDHPTTLAAHRIPVAVPMALLILISTVVAYLCGVAGAARIGSTLMSLVLLSEVLFAVVLSWLLLGEAVTPLQMAGGAGVVAGIALAQYRREPVPVPV
ncbi:EamA family transporter [Nocardia sp. GAS34]|uniref:EamA family transporter n=1 Tax=unclassified Nocardia TaxID=2637762 RepID=UPI003D244D4B